VVDAAPLNAPVEPVSKARPGTRSIAHMFEENNLEPLADTPACESTEPAPKHSQQRRRRPTQQQ
jgi:hypothetical protein